MRHKLKKRKFNRNVDENKIVIYFDKLLFRTLPIQIHNSKEILFLISLLILPKLLLLSDPSFSFNEYINTQKMTEKINC
jgi:hypothetical protein